MQLLSITVASGPFGASGVTPKGLATVQQCRDYLGTIEADDTAAAAHLGELILAMTQVISTEIGYPVQRQRFLASYSHPTLGRFRGLQFSPVIQLPYPVDPVINQVIAAGETIVHHPYGHQAARLDVDAADSHPGTVYEVDFEAGWAVKGGTTVGAPADLAHACVALVAQSWLARGRSPDKSSEDLTGVGGVSFDPPVVPMPIRDILNNYRLVSL